MSFLRSSRTNFYKLNFMLSLRTLLAYALLLAGICSWPFHQIKNCVCKISFWNQTPVSTEEYVSEKYTSRWFCGALWCVSSLLYKHIRREALLLFLVIILNRMRTENVLMNFTGLHVTKKMNDRIWECVLKGEKVYDQWFGSFYPETWRFEENRNWQDQELTGKLVLQ